MLRMEAEVVGEGAPQTEQWPRRPCGSGLGPGPGRVQAGAERVLAEG